MDGATGELERQERDPLEETARFELQTPDVEPPPPAPTISGRHRIRVVPITPAPSPIAFAPPPPVATAPAEDAAEVVEGPPVVRSRDRPRCPYCHEDLAPEVEKAGCQSCLAWHHAACWGEAQGRCATCGRRRHSDGRLRGAHAGWRWATLALGAGLALAVSAWRTASVERARDRADLAVAWRDRANLQYELVKARQEAARARELARTPGDGWNYGAPRAAVERVQGPPDEVLRHDGDEVWRYGESLVTFSTEGRVIAIENAGELHVRWEPR